MKLQSDPTIIYGSSAARGARPSDHAFRDRSADALQHLCDRRAAAGSIANPGRASLEATANPAATKEIFFVADGSGGHAFAETLAQHQQNVSSCASSKRRSGNRRKVRPVLPTVRWGSASRPRAGRRGPGARARRRCKERQAEGQGEGAVVCAVVCLVTTESGRISCVGRIFRGERAHPGSSPGQAFAGNAALCLSHFLSENRCPPRIKSGAGFFREML